ncbi:putative nuclear RNA export factor SDE5 isoform X2 [Apium graveolens]|uniref:putative nuclear RNA export factor SDE5 isoform X2 n=1 Tax=Apium graveolens TaxID=4045 RepID=UPI003D794CB9
MKMELLPANNSYHDDDSKDLEILLEAFSSVVSLEDIASAYCQAGRDVYLASELLCNHNGSISSSSGSKDDPDGASSSKSSTENFPENSCVERNSISAKQRTRPVSLGTVSGVIGKEYSKTKPSSYEQHTVRKPYKVYSSELPPSEVWGENPPNSVASNETMKEDVEEFLFKMLGDGFKLDMGVIRDVLGFCGYDVNKSMETLLDLSASKLDENGGYSCTLAQKNSIEAEGFPSINLQPRGSAKSSETCMLTGVETDSTKLEKDTYDLQKDILNSLFSASRRIEEAPRKIIRPATSRTGRFGRLVLEPPEDIPIGPRTFAKPKVTKAADVSDDSYDVLRKAHKEYFTTMKEYYKAATDAFVNGDRMLSEKLMEQGNFFKKKAKEADNRSTEKLLETSDEEEVVLLDLHDHEPKEALRSLKCHLTSLSAIPHLKVFVGSNDNDTKREARKNRIIELLEKDSIEWTEEDSGQIIVIRVDKVNPKRLSFAKKT